MNNPGNFEEDILKQYLNPEKTEKAPESFTPRLMSRIGYEPAYKISGRTYLIPVISAVFIALLLILAFLFHGSTDKNLLLQQSGFIKNLEVTLSNMSSLTLPAFNIPVRITYALIGLLLLGLFDLVFLRLRYRGSK